MMARLNAFLLERTRGEKYATLFYCTLDSSGLLSYANAGHPRAVSGEPGWAAAQAAYLRHAGGHDRGRAVSDGADAACAAATRSSSIAMASRKPKNADGSLLRYERLRVCLRDNAARDAGGLHAALARRRGPLHRRRRGSRRHHRSGPRVRARVNPTVLYTAAHGGFSRKPFPLGGGAAVCEHLVEEWTRTRPFPFPPDHAGDSGRVRAVAAATWCVSASATMPASAAPLSAPRPTKSCATIPPTTVVLSNDVSEGPDFAALAARGFRIFTIYHVDVVAYVAEIYGRGWIRPETTVRWYPRLRRLLPGDGEAGLGKAGSQRALFARADRSFRGNARSLAALLSRLRAGKIHVLPWGAWDLGSPQSRPKPLRARVRRPARRARAADAQPHFS